jgi:Glycosyltransferase family 87
VSAKTNPLKVIAAVCILAVGLSIIVLVTSESSLADRDYIAYWAIGHQLLAHANPYAQSAFLAWNPSGGHVAIVRYPPSGLAFALLLAQFSPRTAGIVWILALIAALMISIRLLWEMHGKPEDRTHLLGYLFPPVLCCLLAGQVGILLLLAFTVFLYLHERRPFLAGCALSICFMKPHLIVLVFTVLLAWSVSRKRYRILVGTAVALFASSMLPLYFDRHIWHDYWIGIRGEGIQNEFIPTISVVFRLAVHRDWLILQFVPMLAGLIWALAYFWRRRATWDWLQHGPLLAAVGVFVAPYAWVTDEALALPAVLGGLFALSTTRRSIVPYAIFAAVGLVEVLFTVPPGSGYYMWTAPAWIVWSVYASRPAALPEHQPAAMDSV